MSYIPDCRNDENYNEKYLNNFDKEFVRGYDWCVEMSVDNFFDNLDIYFGDDSHIMHLLNEELPENMREEYEIERTFADENARVEKRDVKTYVDLLRSKILDYIEMERDELITSMIDNMDEQEYAKIKAKVDGKQE